MKLKGAGKGAGKWEDTGAADEEIDQDFFLGFDGILDGDAHPFGEGIAIRRVTGLPLTNELVLLHRPSRTLIVTDLVFHNDPASEALYGGPAGVNALTLDHLFI